MKKWAEEVRCSGVIGIVVLVHESSFRGNAATLQLFSGFRHEGFWHPKTGPPIEDAASDGRLSFLRLWMTGPGDTPVGSAKILQVHPKVTDAALQCARADLE